MSQNFFRDYDSTTGRYIQGDPIGLGGGLNSYAYSGSNPQNEVDMYGLFRVISQDTCAGKNFTEGTNCRKSPEDIERKRRVAYMEARGEVLKRAIEKEPDCECKKSCSNFMIIGQLK